MYRFTAMLSGSFILLVLNSAWALGEFTKSCTNIDLVGASLFADCKDQNGRPTNAGISLNNRIGNEDGRLVWENDGNFSGSTRNCDVETSSGRTFLHCDSQRRDGSWTSSSLNLDEHIADINGSLRYEP